MAIFNKKFFNDGEWSFPQKENLTPHIHSYIVSFNHTYNLEELINLGDGTTVVIPTIKTLKCDSCNDEKKENTNHTFSISITGRGSYTITCQDEGKIIAQGKVSDL